MRARSDPPPLQGFTIDIPVRFAECDSYGVVWHGHYALYLEEVRDRLTSKFGFTPAKALALALASMLLLYQFTNFAEHRVLSAFLLFATMLCIAAPGLAGGGIEG